MLVRTTVKKWEGLGKDVRILDSTNGNVFLFNANRINGIKVRASTKSSFMFTEELHNPKAKADYVESEDTAANLVTYSDYTWNSNYIAVSVYPDNVLTETPVLTRINCESIAYVYKNIQYPATKSHIVYYEGAKRRDVICSYSINQVYSLADDGNLTTS